MAKTDKKYAQRVETPTKVIKEALYEFFENDLKFSTTPFKLSDFKKSKTVLILRKSGALEPSSFDVDTLNRRLTNRFKTFISNGILTKRDDVQKDGWYSFTDNAIKLFGGSSLDRKLLEDNNDKDLTKVIYGISLNTILYGPPGTGKTYSTKRKAVEIIEGQDLGAIDDRVYVNTQYKRYVELGQIEFVTFHQSYGYEDFIEGIKPEVKDGAVTYYIADGILKRVAKRAEEASNKNHVLIIDEINRGNVAAIFGEAITLLEDTKRLGAEDEIQITLPYSKTKFGLPKNLYIIGTMNSVDRSAESLDLALRRRFEFEELLPNPKVVAEDIEGVKVRDILTAMNARIEVLVDKHHTIGHAYFINCESAEDVMRVFCFKVMPLLEEIFLDNPKQILDVLLSDKFQRGAVDEAVKKYTDKITKTRALQIKSGPSLFKDHKGVDEIKALINSIVD